MRTFSAFFFVFLIACHGSKKTSSHNPSVTNWYDKKEWLHGLALQPHESINKEEFARQYKAHTAWWDTAFLFLKTHDLVNLPNGKYLLAGDSVYVAVTEGPLKEFAQTKWEGHHRYIDVQYVARGKEKIGVAPVATATVINPYNEEKDVANFSTDGKFYIAEPSTFFIFFPADAHRPSIKVDEQNEKKVVVKVMAAP